MKWTEFAVKEARLTLSDWERRSGKLLPPIAVEDVADLLYSLAIDVTHDLPPNIAGRLYAEDRIIEVKKSDIPTRQRFTIAHEIGHYRLHIVAERWLHGVHICSSAAVGATDELETPPLSGMEATQPQIVQVTRRRDIRRLEIEANRFAAELLMPASLISDAIKIHGPDTHALAQFFDVSLQAMQIRLESLLYIPPSGPQTSFLTDLES